MNVKIIAILVFLLPFILIVYNKNYFSHSISDKHKALLLNLWINSWSKIVNFQTNTSIHLKDNNTTILMTSLSSGQYYRQNKTQHALLSFFIWYDGWLYSWLFLSWYWWKENSISWSDFSIKKLESNLARYESLIEHNTSWLIQNIQSNSLLYQKNIYLWKPLVLIDDLWRIIEPISSNTNIISWTLFNDRQKNFILRLSFSTWSLIVYDTLWWYQEEIERNLNSKEILYIFHNHSSDENIRISWKINLIHKNKSSKRLIFTWILLYDILWISNKKSEEWKVYNIQSELVINPIK